MLAALDVIAGLGRRASLKQVGEIAAVDLLRLLPGCRQSLWPRSVGTAHDSRCLGSFTARTRPECLRLTS